MSNQNKSCCKGSSKGFFIGGIVGGLIGAVTALLFAPKTGEELRRDINIKSAVQAGVDKMKQAAVDAKTRTVNLININKEDEPFN